jgi:hypothetical protein
MLYLMRFSSCSSLLNGVEYRLSYTSGFIVKKLWRFSFRLGLMAEVR